MDPFINNMKMNVSKLLLLLLLLFLYKIEFLLYPNLNVYVYKIPSWRLELCPYLHKQLYLWTAPRVYNGIIS